MLVSVATIGKDIGHMKEGDIAGLAIFRILNGKTIDSAVADGPTIYLRGSALYGSGAAPYYRGKSVPGSGNASFSYSLDNRSFKTLGDELHMRFNLRLFTVNKFCLFHWATGETGGYVDFDWFRSNAGARTVADK